VPTTWYSMTKRLTEHPFRIRFEVTESAANTFTRIDIALPIAALTGGDKAQAIELMGVTSIINPPTLETGQANSINFEVTKDAIASQPTGRGGENYIDGRLVQNAHIGVDGSWIFEFFEKHDMTDYDGNGEIIFERTIHAALLGTGNVGALSVAGWLTCHLVELDTSDVVAAILESD